MVDELLKSQKKRNDSVSARTKAGAVDNLELLNANLELSALELARVDAENNLLMIRGAVPGANGTVVVIKKSARQGKRS